MARLLFVHPRRASFILLDRELLSERHELEDLYQPGRWANPLKVLSAVRRNDAVVAWWASWHSFWPITIAWLLRRPSVLIVGGFDTAAEPEIGYGYQQGGVRRHLARWIMRRAGVLATNSEYTRGEIGRNCAIDPARATVVHHGIPDPFGDDGATGPRERMALTVGVVDHANLERKGLALFAQTAAALPDVRFVVIGADAGGAGELRALAGDNVELRGFVSDDELLQAYRTATVYVQASRHEGFGVAVAEAMLAGCVPVVTPAGALPEVVGDAGIVLEDVSELAGAVERALASGPDAARRARERVLQGFPVSARQAGLEALVERALDQRG